MKILAQLRIRALSTCLATAILAGGWPAIGSAQETDEEQARRLDQVTVTARKREETLQEVPVSISVLDKSLLNDARILSQNELFELVPGIHYDEFIDRNSAAPSVRGVQSNEVATNRTKVTQFIDGMPVLGSQGNIQFENVEQVEVYRGPQSAAFGRSTFGGAVNYITRDPGAEFEGRVLADFDDYGKQRISGLIGGPITDKIGFMLAANWEDSDAPSDFLASDNTQYGALSSEALSGKLVFNPTDALEIELTFSHVESEDGPSIAYFISQDARDACFDGTLYSNMGVGVYATGTLECDWTQGQPIYAQNDREAVLAASGETDPDKLFIAEMQSLTPDLVGGKDERDRVSLQVDYQTDSGALLQFSAFSGDESYIRGNDGSRQDTVPMLIIPGMGVPWQWVTMADPMANPPQVVQVGDIMSDPSDISETYAEVRWVSPGENRLRYVIGASYYSYDFLTDLYFGGYEAVLQGQSSIDRYQALTGVNLGVPTQVFQEEATNTSVFFNLTYDVTERLSLSAEGRYQSDDAGGVDSRSGQGGAVTTDAFLPRLSFTYTVNDNTSFYGQIAKGNNPGGVNVGFFNPDIIANLDGPGQAYVTYDSTTFRYFEEETLYNYELGMKGSAFDNRLVYAAAVFYMDWQDQAQSVNLNWDDPNAPPGPPVPFTTNRTFINEGDVEMSGIEFEGNMLFTENFTLRLTASYLNADYADYCNVSLLGTGLDTDPGRVVQKDAYSCYDVSGFRVAENPSFAASLSPVYRGQLGATGWGWNSRLDIRHQGSEYLDAANVAETTGYTTVNLSAGVDNDNWQLTAYVNNLTEEDTPIRYGRATDYSITTDTAGLGPVNYQSNYLIVPRQGRTVGLRVGYNF